MSHAFEDGLRDVYRTALEQFVQSGAESALESAYEIGKQHLESGQGIAELVQLHHEALHSILDAQPEQRALIVERGAAAMSELLSHLDGELRRLRDYQTEQRLLNERLRGKTHALDQANEALRLAMTKVEDAARAKAAFLANMSHEIRTPMNAVIGMTSLLLDTELDTLQQEFTQTIRTSGEHLLTLINDILDFSKIESGGLELELVPFRLRTCIEEALDLVAARAAEKNLELTYEIEEGTPVSLVGDVGRVRQILLNLLANAVKFTAQGEVTVRARTTRLRDERHEIHISVRDTGLGIPADRLNRLFLPFSQVDASMTRLYGGTGLGLAITKMLTELLGGRTWVESELGKGSTFHFTFKAKEEPQVDPFVHVEVVHEFQGMRVLVVDDNATNRRLLSLYCEKWGMKPTVVASGAEALTLLREGASFELALLDYAMPEMDGVELAHHIRHLVTKPMRFVLLTSVGSTKDLREHFDAAILKPLKPSTLFDTLLSLFAASKRLPVPPKNVDVFDRQLGKRHPLRILVVEDNPVNQKLAGLLLAKLSYTADTAANGREAVDAVARQTYDVVLMDLQMPVLDGLEATREICQRWRPAERPRIIAMTASAMLEDRQQCRAAGMDDYIDKPVQIAALARVLASSNPRGDVTPAPAPTPKALPAVAPPPVLQPLRAPADLANFREASTTLLRVLRSAADLADAQLGSEVAGKLHAVCERHGATRLLPPLAELAAMSRDDFVREAIVKVAQVQREHAALFTSLPALPPTGPMQRR